MPWPASPASCSPLSLSRIRCGDPATPSPLAEAVANEPAHANVLAGLGGGLGDQIGDLELVVADVRLIEQTHFRVEAVELAVHDLVDHVRRLALGLELRGVDLALL